MSAESQADDNQYILPRKKVHPVRLLGSGIIQSTNVSLPPTILLENGASAFKSQRRSLRCAKYIFAHGAAPQIRTACDKTNETRDENGTGAKGLSADREGICQSCSSDASDNGISAKSCQDLNINSNGSGSDTNLYLTSTSIISPSVDSSLLVESPPDPLRTIDTFTDKSNVGINSHDSIWKVSFKDSTTIPGVSAFADYELHDPELEALRCNEVLPTGNLGVLESLLHSSVDNGYATAKEIEQDTEKLLSSTLSAVTWTCSAGEFGQTLPTKLRQSTTACKESMQKWAVRMNRRAGVYSNGVLLRPGRNYRGVATQPSRFCHICLRRAERVALMACAKLRSGMCRKVICEKCFTEFGWDFDAAAEVGSGWTCTHCRRVCPSRAQCFIYKRTNDRRHQALLKKRGAEGVGKDNMCKQSA